MHPLKPDFVTTQPLQEHQQRLEKQAWWRRLQPHEPNQVYIGQRLMYGVLTITWTAWAVIGVLSGHMFFLVSRGGPLHFSGLPALLFSASVLAGAAACGSIIVDHYDRRDNEAAYRRLKRLLWWGAAAFFGCAVIVGIGEKLSLLPWTDGRLGALSGRSLRDLLQAEWLVNLLQPHVDTFRRWFFYTSVWFFIGGFVATKLKVIPGDAHKRPVFVGVVCVFLILPVLTAFTLNLLADIATGRIAQDPGLSENQVRAKVAWMHSMLVAALGVWAFALIAFAMAFLRWCGIVSHPPGYGGKHELEEGA